MYLSADTLYSFEDTVVNDSSDTSTYRIFKAFHKVLLHQGDMQGACDSIYYSYEDSILKMYTDPIIWMEETQMVADTILLHIKKEELKNIDLKTKAFIINYADSTLYNQIKGKNNKSLRLSIWTMKSNHLYIQPLHSNSCHF